MSKTIYSLFFFILYSFPSLSQENKLKNTLGLRIGNNNGIGVEISFQKIVSIKNRLEIDFGWTNDNNTDALKILGIYQWYWKLEKELDWHAGFGSGFGTWNTNDNYNNGYADDNGLFLILNGDIGIEYNFKELPIQISIDLRPEYIFNNYEKNDFGINIGLACRYRF